MSAPKHDEQLDDLGRAHVSERAIDRYEAENSSAIAIHSLDDISRLSKIFIQSGMFKGDQSLSPETQVYQAGVKIIAGVEFGIQPFASMRGINIINGNAEMSSNLMAAKVKKHPKYDYKVVESSNEGCTLEFTELVSGKTVSLGKSTWTIDDAKRAGLTRNPTWQKFPMNMCFARALSNGVRMYTPDVFYGAPVYVEGEISGEFPEKAEDTAQEPPATKTDDEAEPVEGEVVDTAQAPVGDEPTQDTPADALQEKLDEIAELAAKLGHGPDWFVHVSTLINTIDDAEAVYTKLRATEVEREMSGDA
ncbi:hypothetical protein G3I13_01830 [Streptomyces sp. SID6673]|nr:hypothetical protein [Streptomyces sp. SID11726]NDZ94900.1 hypothetical protein [Streptomyces sp. SID11726]NEB23060.1 hypothetical protein [Streptomyces sp. SID6673]